MPVADTAAATGNQAQLLRFGREQQPLLLLDHCWPDPAGLRALALSARDVGPAGGGYPGLRCRAPAVVAQFLQQRLAAPVRQLFGLQSADWERADSYFSLVCTPPGQLTLAQSMPHVDRANPAELAAVLYLCAPSHGGTSFYRHRRSGFEMLTPARLACYQQQLATDLQQHGPPSGYINGDTALFERILQVPAMPNRLILYRCSSLHSGDITAQQPLDTDPATGRLTLTLFFGAGGCEE